MSIQQTKLEAFLSDNFTAAGISVRKPTMGTLLALIKSGNVLQAKSLAGFTVQEITQSLSHFIWLHTRPIDEVIALTDGDQEKLNAELLKISDKLDAEKVEPLAVGLHSHLRAMFSTLDWEVKGAEKKTTTPNGQPATSPE